jgi:hypothetical protein
MEILDAIFYGPLPIVYIFLLFLFFTSPKISTKKWAKLGVLLGIILLYGCTIAYISATVAKRYDGNRLAETGSLTAFTKQVSALIADGKHKKAKELLDNHDDAEKLMARLIEESRE